MGVYSFFFFIILTVHSSQHRVRIKVTLRSESLPKVELGSEMVSKATLSSSETGNSDTDTMELS